MIRNAVTSIVRKYELSNALRQCRKEVHRLNTEEWMNEDRANKWEKIYSRETALMKQYQYVESEVREGFQVLFKAGLKVTALGVAGAVGYSLISCASDNGTLASSREKIR